MTDIYIENIYEITLQLVRATLTLHDQKTWLPLPISSPSCGRWSHHRVTQSVKPPAKEWQWRVLTNYLTGVLFALRIPKLQFATPGSSADIGPHGTRHAYDRQHAAAQSVCDIKVANDRLLSSIVSRSIGIAVLAFVVTVDLKGSYTCIAGQTRPRLTI